MENLPTSDSNFISTKKIWAVFSRRWLPGLAVFVPIILLTSIAASIRQPLFEAQGKLLFQKNNTLSSLTGVGTDIGRLEALTRNTESSPLNTEAEVIRSVSIVNKTISRLNLTDDKGEPLTFDKFISRLTVKNVPGSDVLQIAYQDHNPETAAAVVNMLMNVYLEHYESLYKAEVSAARRFLEKQLPIAERIVRQAEANLAAFRENNNVVSLQDEKSESVKEITQIQSKTADIKNQIANVTSQAQEIRKQLQMNSKEAVTQSSLSQSAGVQDTIQQIQQTEVQLVEKRAVFNDNHPQVVQLQNKLAALKQLLQGRAQQVAGGSPITTNSNLQIGQTKQQLTSRLVELESTRQGLVSELASASNYENNYKQRLTKIPRLEQQERQLEGKVRASQSTYSLLLQKLQESRIAENQTVGNASKISEAIIPRSPVSSALVYYLSGGLIGSLLALATMYILDVRDKTIKTFDEAKDLLGLTILGVIPTFNKSKKSIRGEESLELPASRLVVRDMPRSPISEAFRMLRANLKFMSADKELKVIVITSSVPGEGKSTIAANLALAMAQMERQVLLVDADLHQPVQHQIWELTNSQGLSNLIVGQSEINHAVKKVMANLDVLTAGVVPPSPASLLDSKRMASLIQNFGSSYDFVIIDAPSLNVAADAATLGQMADGVLLVVRPGVVDSVNAALAAEILEKSGQNVLGQVINAVIPQNESHSYYYFTKESDFQEHTVSSPKSEANRF